MNNKVQEVQVRAVVPLEGSFAVFLGNEEKTFVIYVDEPVGMAISMFMRGITKERPLTHDLMASLMRAFGAKVERAVINDVNGSVFYARLIIAAENQLHSRKLIELDARPSDSIALAMHQGAPVFVARKVLDSVEDMSEALEQIEKRGLDPASGKASAKSGEKELEEAEDDDDEALFSEEDDEDEDDEGDFDEEDEDEDFDEEDEDDEEDGTHHGR
jgi:bifunctional DNase/RNase